MPDIGARYEGENAARSWHRQLDTAKRTHLFGDLAPGATITGAFHIGVSAIDGAPLNNQVVTGFDVSCEHRPYQGVELSPLLACENLGQIYLTHECPVCDLSQTSELVGGPINTANGNYTYQQSGPQIATVGPPLQFRWTYNSLNSGVDPGQRVLSSTLSPGWTHNYQMWLDLSAVNGPERSVVVRAAHGTPLQFLVVRDGFAPVPGLRATMTTTEVAGGALYTVTTGTQATYVFSDTGRLLRQIDAQSNLLAFSYNTAGQLVEVLEPVSQRFLHFAYDDSGRLQTVTDPIGRTLDFGYNVLGHLTVVTDTGGAAWQYDYTALTGGENVLSYVADPDGRVLEQTTFDDLGRAISQTFRGRQITITYHGDGRRVVQDGLGNETTYIYNSQNLLVADADATAMLERYALDFYQNRVTQEDRNGNATRFEKTAFGYPTVITDALDAMTAIAYDEANNPTTITDARGATTALVYDAQNNPLTQTNALEDSVLFTYNAYGQLSSRTDENGNKTEYGYDVLGQLAVITDAHGFTTTFGYDGVGRLITTTDTLGQITVKQYDAMDHLVQATANYRPGAPQNYLNEYNLITRYAYDGAGRTISTTNTLGRTDLTFYDSAGRVVATVANWDGSSYTTHDDLCNFTDPDPEHNSCSLTAYDSAGRVQATTDALGRVTRTFYDERNRVVATVQNWSGAIMDPAQCAFPPISPDADLCTLYEYDAAGNTVIVTDTVGQQTRTFYDVLNRLEATVQNWTGTITDSTDCDFTNVPGKDQNLCTLYEYDEVGNTTIVTDTAGRITRTFYDALNRVEGAVQNWQAGFALEDCFDPGLDPHGDENVCTVYAYDAAGNRTATTNAREQRSLTVYDSANRPVVQVQNWDGATTITANGNGCADTMANPNAGENLCTFTVYDALGRRASTTDVLGNITEFAYDGLGRVVTTTRYLDGAPVQTVTSYDALGNRLSETDANGHTTTYSYDSLNRLELTTSHEGVTTSQTYNAAGWILSTIDGLGHTTTNSHDDLGRLLSTTDPENNTTQYEYDATGNQVALIDAEGVRTSYGYDALDRLVSVTENDSGGAQTDESNLLTQYAYDALGNRTVVTNARGFTVTHTLYDNLNRPATVYDALGHTTQYSYDLLGNRTVVTDANGAVTDYNYDALNRLITTTYAADSVTVTYQYDAAGNRVQMVDDVGTTSYVYDDFYRLITVTNPFSAVVGYRYDDAGNRTQLIYPDGREVGYSYDGDNRLVEVEDWNSGLTTYEYDVAGRLITTTLPNGVVSVNAYDDANRLLSLRHEGSDSSLLAEYLYTLDGVGNRVAVTETVRAPDVVQEIEAYVEQNGLLVLEAENGTATSSTSHDWETQTAQAGYEGTGYRRALPDIGARYEETGTAGSPRLSWAIYNETADVYSVWVRGMASGAGGDSLHVGLDSAAPSSAADLTGFTNEWVWSKITMGGTDASVNLTTTGTHTLQAWMREDGLRVDRVLLVTDTNYIPSGMGPAESPFQMVTETVPGGLQTQVVQHSYDGLHRLTQAAYSGAFSATFQYGYDAVGNRVAYTTTITTTTVITYQYDAANRLLESAEQGGDATVYEWDGAGRLITTTVSSAVTRLYHYDQRGNLTSATVDGLATTFDYDGDNHRLRMSVGSNVVTYTLDYARISQVLFEEGGAYSNTKHYLYGLACLGERVDADNPETAEWRYYQQDGNQMVRQTTDESGAVTLAWTYSPEGMVLKGEEGPVTHLGCEGNAIYDWSTGLIFKGGRYWDPRLGIWLAFAPLLLVWQVRQPKARRRQVKRRKRKKTVLALCLLSLLALFLAGCVEPPAPPTTPCPSETQMPTYKPGVSLGEKTGELPASALVIRYESNNGLVRIHRGTAISANAILTSDHWADPIVDNPDNIAEWELVDPVVTSQSWSTKRVAGTGSEIRTKIYEGQFGLIVIDPTLGSLSPTAELGEFSFNVFDVYEGYRFEQAVAQGSTPGLYLVETIGKNTEDTLVKLSPDATVGGDSGMGLFRDGRIYGANFGGAGWYGVTASPSELRNQMRALSSSF